MAAMTTARSTVGVAVLNGKLYAVGGRDGSACLSSIESFDPHTNKWKLNCPMMKRRGGKRVIHLHLTGSFMMVIPFYYLMKLSEVVS